MKHRKYIEIIPVVLIIIISLLLFRGAFRIYFFQDDFFFFLISRAKNFTDLFHFFIPRTDVQFYRPVSSEIYYLLSRTLFGYSPFGYHLIGIITYLATIFIAYKTAYKLFNNKTTAYLFTFFYALSPIHNDSLYWIANYSYLAVDLIYLLAFYLFIKNTHKTTDYLKIILLFAIGLFTNEFIIGLPLILFFYSIFFRKKSEIIARWFFPSLILMAISYLLFRFVIFHSDTRLYTYIFDRSVIYSARWFLLYFFGWPELVKHYMIRFYYFSPLFVSKYFSQILLMVLNFFLFNIVYLLIPVYYYLNNNQTKQLRERLPGIAFSLIWVIVNLLPIIFIPSQISPHRGALSYFGFLLFFFFLSGRWLKTKHNIGINLLITLSICIWLVNSFSVVRLNERVHWVKNRSDLAKKWTEKIKHDYPVLNNDDRVNIVSDDSEVKYALGEGRALKYIYNNNLLEVIFSTQSATMYKNIEITL